eukprot:15426325-Heterocapsa_arctica.AAC.1
MRCKALAGNSGEPGKTNCAFLGARCVHEAGLVAVAAASEPKRHDPGRVGEEPRGLLVAHAHWQELAGIE